MALTRGIPSRKRLGRSVWAAALPLIGRAHLVDAMLAKRPAACVVLGEMGAGKSRLLAEARTRTVDGRVFTIVCQRGAELLPLDPLVSLVRSLFRDGCLAATQRDAVLGASERDRLSYIREALETAATRPLVFQFDDLHWADSATPDALRYCIDRLQDVPIKWHLTSRVGYSSIDDFAFALERAGLSETLAADGLTLDELRNFATSVAPVHTIDEPALTRLFERTGGNPLYAELLLTSESSEYGEIPRTLRCALHDRLSALSAEAKDVAAWIAVHRGPLQQGSIAALSRYSPAQVLTALTELQDKGIARRTQDGYAFRHELLRDVCYESLEEAVRSARHQELAERTVDEWQRAGHFDGARRYEESAALLIQIGWDRLDKDAPSESHAAFELSLDRVNPDGEAAWEARAGIAAASYALGKVEAAEAGMRDFEARAPGLSSRLRVMARCRFADAAWTSAQDYDAAVPALELAIAEAPAVAPEFLPRLYCILGAALERRGRLADAKAALEKGIEHCDQLLHKRESIRLRARLGVVLGRLGSAREGIELLESAANRASDLGMTNDVASCCTMLCYLCDMIADVERYEYWCRRGLDVAGPKSRRTQALLLNNLAYVATDKGRLQEALGLSIASAAAADPSSSIAVQSHCGQANLYAMLGDFESADRAVAEARSRRVTVSWQRAVEFTAGFVCELAESFDDALVAYERAVGSSGDINEVYELRALAGIVRAARRLGNHAKAQAALERLRGANRHGWPVARQLVREAEGYWKVLTGDVARGCDDLLATAAECPDRYWQTHLRMVVADQRGDRETFIEVIDAFDALGATSAADLARSLARAHGLRPGRKREAHGSLSEREISVALLVASGKTNAEIGELLHVSGRTVEYHLTNILGKCGLRSRVEIAIRVAAGTLLGGTDEASTQA